MIDEGFYVELILLALFSLVLAALILFVFSKPFKTLFYILKSRKIRAEIINIPLNAENSIQQIFTPIAAYEDESGLHTLILRKEDFFAYGKLRLRDGCKVTVFADKNGGFTTLYYFFGTLIQAVLLAAMPALLLSGTVSMIYCEITDYQIIERILNKI
ncbi:MAG: hypothetical protein K2H23_05700 [Oscillospiraceae bacterium]|nr:hypothetical protein [Oscillospiraceae bacterium]